MFNNNRNLKILIDNEFFKSILSPCLLRGISPNWGDRAVTGTFQVEQNNVQLPRYANQTFRYNTLSL